MYNSEVRYSTAHASTYVTTTEHVHFLIPETVNTKSTYRTESWIGRRWVNLAQCMRVLEKPK